MKAIIGIDIGGSTTKIVGYTLDRTPIGVLQVKAADPLTSMFGALGKFITQYQLALSDITQILLTGVGSSLFTEDIYGIPTRHVDEFVAIGLGGLALSGREEAIIVSMGTGTAFVRAARGGDIRHLGGSGVGGGTLFGLCGRLGGARHFDTIMDLAAGGDLSKVDLSIGDISKSVITTLPPDTTASNFGKIEDSATEADLALGVINMVFQCIGTLSYFAGLGDTVRDVVLTGTLTTLPQAQGMFRDLGVLYGIHFLIPENAIYATATGAALSYFGN